MTSKIQIIDMINKKYEEDGYDSSSDNDLTDMNKKELMQIFEEVFGYNIQGEKDGGEIVKVENKFRGGLMRKPKLAKRGF
jgi:hypothetical protein